ncbi:MAG: hypothetical protein CML09_02505 [Puniceicoccaceae bacterium]|nr:hypothetical protein [Puniceicoccaceae bacterium]
MIDAILPLIEAGKLMSTESIWLDWWQGDKPNSSSIYLKQLLSDQIGTLIVMLGFKAYMVY